MPRTDTRTRMVISAIDLLRERGADGVTLDAVLADSSTPRGSIYHHFPGGRDELVRTAGRTAANHITHLLGEAAQAGDPVAVLEQFAAFWKQALIDSDYKAGCPVAGLATNTTGTSADLIGLAEETFTDWTRLLIPVFERAGADKEQARSLTTMSLASVEGALLLCRANRSAQPLDDVITHLRPLLTSQVQAH